MLRDFRERVVAAGLVNREYEGLATRGNTVRITSAVEVAISDYADNDRTTSASAVSDLSQDLLIDQEKAFDFYVDDIDRAQAAGSMDAYTASAADGLAEDADKFILSEAVTAATEVTTDVTSLGDGDDAFNVVRDLRKALNKNHVPVGNRVLFCNAEFEAVLLDASSKLTAADVSGSPEGIRNATVGRLLGFQVVTTENMPETDEPQALALYQPAYAYVSQVEKTEGMRAQDKFADRLRGLHVYGGKAIRPSGLVVFGGPSS